MTGRDAGIADLYSAAAPPTRRPGKVADLMAALASLTADEPATDLDMAFDLAAHLAELVLLQPHADKLAMDMVVAISDAKLSLARFHRYCEREL